MIGRKKVEQEYRENVTEYKKQLLKHNAASDIPQSNS